MESFNELAINPALQRAIGDLGYEKPTPIQAQTLPKLLTGNRDFIGLAATGTGKTVAFTLPMLERLDPEAKGVQAIILCPTRELCMQVTEQVNLLGKYLKIQATPIYGGAGYDEQFRRLKQGSPIVVGTPGRVIDHIEKGTLRLETVKIVVLDEADEMISMGFREAMETILETVDRAKSNVWLFSATMSSSVRRVADRFLKQPEMVQVNRTEMLSSGVEQRYYLTHEANKPEVLCKLIDAAEDFYGVIFCQTKSLVIDLTRYLSGRGYKVDCLHGDLNQSAREVAMLAFRQKRARILICTDVASRGLDVKDITHVINYSLPRELDSYVHRIGRTARSGKTGLAMSLVTPSHRHLVQKIERMTKSTMIQGEIPSRKSIGLKKIAAMLTPFQEQAYFKRAMDLLDTEWKTAVAGMTPEEVAARFLAMNFPWVFADEKQQQMERSDRPASGDSRPQRPRDAARQQAFDDRRSRGEGKPARQERDETGSYEPRPRPKFQGGGGGFRKPDTRGPRPTSSAGFRRREDKVGGDLPPRRASASKDSKDERRFEKRTEKRDFKKKFSKGYQPYKPKHAPSKAGSKFAEK